MEARWIRVTDVSNIPEREGRAVAIGDRDIAIFNLGDRVLAADNRCPHEGGPLCDGIVTGDSVVCPLHTWKVSLVSGRVERPTGAERCVRTYPARVEDGIIVVAVPVGAPAATAKRNSSFNTVPTET
jgi:nitrite reductase (NADH) small subunit